VTNFIYKRENALSDSLCRSFIETFETDTENQVKGSVNIRGEARHDWPGKRSTDISFNPNDLNRPRWKFLLTELINVLELGKSDYNQQFYRGMEQIDPWEIHHVFNIQRYLPGEGYSDYHCERAGLTTGNRMGVWMIYLNDVYDKGWTEFYYQQHYEKAEAGKLVIWPCDFTHLHRGIISHTETKYVITGWYSWVKNPPKLSDENEKS
jgi:hypothetical protein